MATLTKRQRMEMVLSGKLPDRPPISAWRHHTEFEHSGAKSLADAMITFQRKYDWDFVKINPRAVYYHEAWGNRYDFTRYNDVVPTLVKKIVDGRDDLAKVVEVDGKGGVFAEQLEAVRLVVEALGAEAPVYQTIFTPIGILLNLCGLRSLGRYRESPREESLLIKFIETDKELVHAALGAVARTLASYAEGVVQAGADGVFYAALGMARSGYLTREEWEEFVRPYDLIVLEALKPIKTIVHTCGIRSNPEWFVDYPIDVIHWAESAPGNPTLQGSMGWLKGKIAMGGVDERVFGQNKATEIGQMARTTIERMKNQPFLLTPDCSVSIKTLDDELKAFRAAVELR